MKEKSPQKEADGREGDVTKQLKLIENQLKRLKKLTIK